MSTNRGKSCGTPRNEQLLSNEKELTIGTCNNMDESQNNYAELKKPNFLHLQWFHLRKISENAYWTPVIESRSTVLVYWGRWESGSYYKRQEQTSGSNRSVFILIGLMVSLLKHTSQLSYTLNMLFTVHQLYLNKIVKTIILGRSKGIVKRPLLYW